MENFQYINIPDTQENSKFISKGFEYISNQFFDSIGQGLLIAYLFQSLSLTEYQYGLQLLRSFSQLLMPNQYTNLKTSLLCPQNNFELSQSLSNLFSPQNLSEIQELGEELVDESSFVTLQASLRNLSKKLNMHIIVFYQQETIEFNYLFLPRPIIIGISLDIKSKYSLFSTQQQVLNDTQSKQIYIDQLIKVTCDILEKHNVQFFFGYELKRLLGAVDTEVQQNVSRLPKKFQIIKFSSAPILRNTDFRAANRAKILKPSYELPHSLEKITHFLNEFVSDHPRKIVILGQNNEIFLEDESHSFSSSISDLNISRKCANCGGESIDFNMIDHPCSLCQQCCFESFLTKSCQSCSYAYTESELETLGPYFN